jgi:hypothetical protein
VDGFLEFKSDLQAHEASGRVREAASMAISLALKGSLAFSCSLNGSLALSGLPHGTVSYCVAILPQLSWIVVIRNGELKFVGKLGESTSPTIDHCPTWQMHPDQLGENTTVLIPVNLSKSIPDQSHQLGDYNSGANASLLDWNTVPPDSLWRCGLPRRRPDVVTLARSAWVVASFHPFSTEKAIFTGICSI